MRIQPGSQLGQSAPSIRPLFEDILASKSLDELLFTLTKWMDASIEETVRPVFTECILLYLSQSSFSDYARKLGTRAE
jgi:hypothetical protein